MEVKDSNGNLKEGDSVTDLKRGQAVKNIVSRIMKKRSEGKVNGTMLVLKTRYLKKV